MRSRIVFLVKYLCLWLLIFNFHRLVFGLIEWDYVSNGGPVDFFAAFFHALPLDISMACYILLFPLLLVLISLPIANNNWLKPMLSIYTTLVLLVVALLQAGDLAVYPEWQTKVGFKVLVHLMHPSEAIKSATWGYSLLFLGAVWIQLVLGFVVYRWLFKELVLSPTNADVKSVLKALGMWLVLVGLCLLGVRGSLRTFPINVSSVYFSKDPTLNDMAVNTPWNFMNNVLDNQQAWGTNVLSFYPLDEACSIKQDLSDYADTTATPQLLTQQRPNVVVLILESWQADVVGCLGGTGGLTPFFDSLSRDGVLFSNFYANAHTSDKGNAAILSGYPAFPTNSIITQPDKYRKIPAINQPMEQVGYHSSYHYGGQLIYANIKGFLADHQFDAIFDINDLEDKWPTSTLGVPDEYMYQELHQYLNNTTEPFMSCMFTLSTHSPYDIPRDAGVEWGGEHQPYLNTIKYADESLQQFFDSVRHEPWYSNTLFVLVADHGHVTPTYYTIHDARRSRIPLLFYGDVIKEQFRGKVHDKIGSQIDIAATLLQQLNLPHTEFKHSKDLLDPDHPQFAPFTFHNGIGWVRPDGFYGYELSYKVFLPDSFNQNPHKERLVKEGFSYFECSFQEFLDL